MKKENGVKIYVNRLPNWFDLEELIYRPLLTKLLPTAVGFVTRIFGENKLLTPLCHFWMKASGFVTRIFGENRVLAPVYRFAVSASGVCARAAADSLDAVTLMLRRTLFRDLAADGKRQHKSLDANAKLKAERKSAVKEGVADATDRIITGFSFALLLACFGVCVILAVVLYNYFARH